MSHEDDVLELFDRANPIPEPRTVEIEPDAHRFLAERLDGDPVVVNFGEAKGALSARRRQWLPPTAAAAVVAIVIAGLLALSSRDGATPAPADSNPISVPTPTMPPPTKVQLATSFWEAVAAGDRDVAASFTSPTFLDAHFNSLFGRADAFNEQFDWYESVGWTWTLDECTERDDTRVNCVVAASNPWSDALGESPVSGTIVVAFSDDGITSISDRSFSDQWVANVFSPFQQWVLENHPDDAAVMFDFSVDVNPEILDLYEINTERFTNAQRGS